MVKKNLLAIGAAALILGGCAGKTCDIGQYNIDRKNETNIGVQETSLSNAGNSLENVLRDVTIGGIDSSGNNKNPGVLAGPFRAVYSLVTLDPKGFVENIAGTVQSAIDIPTDVLSFGYNITIGNVMPKEANSVVNSGFAGLQQGMDGKAFSRLFDENNTCKEADLGYTALGLAADTAIGLAIKNATKSSPVAAKTATPVCPAGFIWDGINCI